MMLAFKILLMVIIGVCFIGAVGTKDKKDQDNMVFLAVMAMGSFLVSVAFL